MMELSLWFFSGGTEVSIQAGTVPLLSPPRLSTFSLAYYFFLK
jgi:hypothetical protein